MKLPSARRIWFRLHWLVGLSAGTLLILVGLSGASLSFREEIIDALNPQGRHVAERAMPALTPPQLLTAVRQAWPQRRVGTLALFADPGAAARVIFEPEPGRNRGATVYLDLYTGKPLAPLVGAGFFDWAEDLHRWLLLPREQGRTATGILAAGLLLLALSGLYLRWPRRPLSWRAWITFNTGLRGRAFLWGLHSVMGSCALLLYLVSATTGLYWAFDAVRDRIDALAAPAGTPSAARPASRRALRQRSTVHADVNSTDLAPAWTAFEQQARSSGGWSQVILRVQPGNSPTVLFTWLDATPAHERARNRTIVRLLDGEVIEDERHADKTTAGRLVAAIHPLHMGSYFGLPGRLVMTVASLMLPVFAITGWLLFLLRKKTTMRNLHRRIAGGSRFQSLRE